VVVGGGVAVLPSVPSTPTPGLTGEGKDMVPETHPSDHVWTGTQMRSSLPQSQINSSQLISFVSGSVPLLSGAGRVGR
jgi:hypothetical protein